MFSARTKTRISVAGCDVAVIKFRNILVVVKPIFVFPHAKNRGWKFSKKQLLTWCSLDQLPPWYWPINLGHVFGFVLFAIRMFYNGFNCACLRTSEEIAICDHTNTSFFSYFLGGNSLTSMIATCSLEESNVGETISTCRFAQRVALIKNEVERNEIIDPLVEIELLKKQIVHLKNNCALLHGGAELASEALTEEERKECKEKVAVFLNSEKDDDVELNVAVDWRKIQCCFLVLKNTLSDRPAQRDDPEVGAKMQDLQRTLQQRDRELTILCKLLRQEKKRIDELMRHSSAVKTVGHGVRNNWEIIYVFLTLQGLFRWEWTVFDLILRTNSCIYR